MRAVRLVLRRPAGARVRRWRPVTAIWLFLRAESRRHWRAWLSLALIVGVFAGGVATAAEGARRTGSAYARFLDWSRAPDAVVAAEPYDPSFARLSPAAVMRVPQAADAAVIKSFNVTPGIVQFIAPASNAIPGSFWKRKILSGRLADPARPGEVNVSFTLAERFHLRAGDPLRLVLSSAAGRPVPFVFHVAGIDAAQIEVPAAAGERHLYRLGHPRLLPPAPGAERIRPGSAAVPPRQPGLARGAAGTRQARATASSCRPFCSPTQSVNTERSIRPQAVALWLLAVLFGVIGLLIVGQLLARLSFLEAAEYGTLRALGMSRAQLMTACLGRAAAIGAAGGVIGAVLGVALSPLLPVGLAGVAEPHPGIDADVPVLAAGLAAAVLVTAGCAAWPGWRAAARAAAGHAGRARPAAPHGHLPAGGRRAGPAGHGHPAGPAPRRGPDSGAGTQRDRQRGRGRGRAQRRDRVRRQPQPPARLARPVRRDLGRHSEQHFRERRPPDSGHGQARPAGRGVDHLLDRGTIARRAHRLRGDRAPAGRRRRRFSQRR